MRIGTASWEGNRQEKNVTFYEPHKSRFGTWRLLESYTTLTQYCHVRYIPASIHMPYSTKEKEEYFNTAEATSL